MSFLFPSWWRSAPPPSPVVSMRHAGQSPSPLDSSVDQAAQTIFQTKILSGTYCFVDNCIRLKIARTPVDQEGTLGTPQEETVAFEVTDLTIKDGAQKDIHLLGARTEEVIRPIMEQMIESLKTLEDLSFLRRESALKGELQTKLTFKPQSITVIKDEITSQEMRQVGQEELKIDQPARLHQLLNPSHWISLAQGVQESSVKKHEWVFKLPSRKMNESLVNRLTDALFESKDSGTPLFKLLPAQLQKLKEQHDKIREEKELLLQLQNQIEADRPKNSESKLFRIKDQIQQLQKIENHLFIAKRTILNILIFDASRHFSEQREFIGTAPLGALLSQDWHDLLKEGELFEEVPIDSVELQEFLKEKLSPLADQAFEVLERELSDFKDKMVSIEEELFLDASDRPFSDREFVLVDELTPAPPISELRLQRADLDRLTALRNQGEALRSSIAQSVRALL